MVADGDYEPTDYTRPRPWYRRLADRLSDWMMLA